MNRIDSIVIKNWRSIHVTEVLLGSRTVLVGENGAGKSNVLDAIHLVLGDSFPSRARISSTDVPTWAPGADLEIQVSVEEDELGLLSFGIRWDASEDQFETFQEQEHRGLARLTNVTRNRFPAMLIQATRSASSDLSGSAFSLLGRVQSRLHEVLIGDDERVQEVVAAFDGALAPLSTDVFAQFADHAQRAFRETTVGAGYDARLEFAAYDPSNFYRAIRPLVEVNGRLGDVGQAGDGLSNLATIAVARAAAEMNRGTAVLLVEEPESWLHPHALRALDRALRAAEDDGVQVVIATHAPELLRPSMWDEIAVVRRNAAGATVVSQVDESTFVARRQSHFQDVVIDPDGLRQRYEHLFHIDQAEGFLARGVVLVEGETERVLIPALLEALGEDLNRLGLSVVSAEGKTKLDQFHDLFTAFGIPVFLLFDSDSRSEQPATNARYNRLLTEMAGLEEGVADPQTMLGECFASVGPHVDAVLDADLDRLQPGLSEQLRRGARQTYPGASKVVQTRYIVTQLSGTGRLAELAQLTEVAQAIRTWAQMTGVGDPPGASIHDSGADSLAP